MSGALLEIVNITKDQILLQNTRANCLIVIDTIINFHEHGVRPTSVDTAPCKGTTDRKHKVGTALLCSQRIAKVVELTRIHKRIALDIIKGDQIIRFVENPDQYMHDKFQYLKSNLRKAATAEAGKLAKKAADEALGIEPVDTKRKGKSSQAQTSAECTQSAAMISISGTADDIRRDEQNGAVTELLLTSTTCRASAKSNFDRTKAAGTL